MWLREHSVLQAMKTLTYRDKPVESKNNMSSVIQGTTANTMFLQGDKKVNGIRGTSYRKR